MTFSLDDIVPWGRSFEEYTSMFALSESDLKKSILGCGDGPASFNSILSKQNGNIISVDPLYQFSPNEIKIRIDKAVPKVIESAHQNKDNFHWDQIPSPEKLGEIRMQSMNQFLSDYPKGIEEGRYVKASLPNLPFNNQRFELALCSHLLFLYSNNLTYQFHLNSIEELCRVAQEIRIFPLLELDGKRSRHIDSILSELRNLGKTFEVQKVNYEFQKNGNEMLKITSH